jgi:hypothetical protein
VVPNLNAAEDAGSMEQDDDDGVRQLPSDSDDDYLFDDGDADDEPQPRRLPPANKKSKKQRQFISIAQWFRFMACHHNKWFNEDHWLWDWGKLAQLYTLTYCNRLQADKVRYMKTIQDKYKFVRPKALMDYLKKVLQNKSKVYI